jgi:hypothetical protein
VSSFSGEHYKGLYGYFIDGLDKQCISSLGSKLGKNIPISNKKTIEALTSLFPDLETSPSFTSAVSLVSDKRRLASHGVRPPSERFPAFSTFTNDLSLCLKAVKEILTVLEREFGIDGEKARSRHEAKKLLPKIARPPDEHYSIVQASRMNGKTVEKVTFGSREEVAGTHQSEVLIIYFTDGSIMSLEAGSNVSNLVNGDTSLRPEEFHVDFIVHWVPALPKRITKPLL